MACGIMLIKNLPFYGGQMKTSRKYYLYRNVSSKLWKYNYSGAFSDESLNPISKGVQRIKIHKNKQKKSVL